MKFYIIFVTLQFFVNESVSYRILGVFPTPSYSHYILGGRLMKALAEKGHDVTMIAPYKEKKPIKFYRGIFLEEIAKSAEGIYSI